MDAREPIAAHMTHGLFPAAIAIEDAGDGCVEISITRARPFGDPAVATIALLEQDFVGLVQQVVAYAIRSGTAAMIAAPPSV